MLIRLSAHSGHWSAIPAASPSLLVSARRHHLPNVCTVCLLGRLSVSHLFWPSGCFGCSSHCPAILTGFRPFRPLFNSVVRRLVRCSTIGVAAAYRPLRLFPSMSWPLSRHHSVMDSVTVSVAVRSFGRRSGQSLAGIVSVQLPSSSFFFFFFFSVTFQPSLVHLCKARHVFSAVPAILFLFVHHCLALSGRLFLAISFCLRLLLWHCSVVVVVLCDYPAAVRRRHHIPADCSTFGASDCVFSVMLVSLVVNVLSVSASPSPPSMALRC